MIGIIKSIQRNDRVAETRGWDRTYWFFDIHETLIRPNYKKEEIPTDFYPFAKEVMQILSTRKEICRVLYTCSWPEEIVKYLEFFNTVGIGFEYVNKNPEVKSLSYGCYDDKPYINVLFDDKAGFDPDNDWEILYNYFIEKFKLTEEQLKEILK